MIQTYATDFDFKKHFNNQTSKYFWIKKLYFLRFKINKISRQISGSIYFVSH